MTDYGTFRKCYEKTNSHELKKETIIQEFGEDIARIMFAENQKERFIATLYLNDKFLDEIINLKMKLENIEVILQS